MNFAQVEPIWKPSWAHVLASFWAEVGHKKSWKTERCHVHKSLSQWFQIFNDWMLLKRHSVLAHSVLVILNSSGVQEKRRARITRNTSKDLHKAIHTLPEKHLTLCAWSNSPIDLHHCLSSNRPHKAARKTRGLYCLTHWNFQPLMDKFRFVLSIKNSELQP